MKIYGLGGTGINIAKLVENRNFDLEVVYIDSSDANLKEIGNSSNTYHIEGLNGAGKNRSISYKGFREEAADILIKFPPAEDINIIVSSLSGGTGSSVSPLLVKELVDAGHPVIIVGIESHGSIIELTNTVNTLKSFKGISKLLKKSVALYQVNDPIRSKADQQAVAFINLMAILIDKKATKEFDITDLRNFVHFDEVSNRHPDVGVLQVVDTLSAEEEKGTSIVATILLTKNSDTNIEEVIPDYLATCLVVDEDAPITDYRINNSLGKLSLVIGNYEDKINMLRDNKKINKIKEVDVESNTDDGFMVL